MGNFEKLSVLVIVVIIVMILVVALYTWTDKPSDAIQADSNSGITGTEEEGTYSASLPDDGDLPEDPWGTGGIDDGTDEVDVDGVDEGDDADIDDSADTDDVDEGDESMDAGDGVDEADAADRPASDDPTVNEQWVYEVKKGDTIGHIAMRELFTVRRQGEIYDLNPGLDALRLQIGQKLRMPARGTPSDATPRADATANAPAGTGTARPGTEYVTRRGDQLRTIAKDAYGDGQRWPEIFAKNWGVIDDPERVPPGVKIFIPK